MRESSRLAVIAVLLLAGCATHAGTGTVVGATGGAVVGGVIGKVAGSTAKGAIIGAVVGGAAGAIIGARMDRQAKELEQNIKGATVERVGEGIQVTFASGLLFDFDSDVPRSEAKVNLRELALSLAKFPDSDLLILGHTDQVGTSAYNQGLSSRRGNAVASYLMAQGVDGTRMAARGLGETEPIATNDTEAGRQSNRRVEVSIFASKEARAAATRGGE
jgi:outer membrane protein OmpA-like peptidoglycan-associated protein